MVKSWACRRYFTMPPPARFVARRCIDPALKGPNRKAQGNALGIEGDLYESALKGRHSNLFRPFRAEQKEAGRDGPQPGSPGVARGFPVRPLQGQKRRCPPRKRIAREAQNRSRPTFHHAQGEAPSEPTIIWGE